MRVFLTGASGFIGAVLSGRILARGWDLNILVRNPAKIPYLYDKPGVRFIKGDLDDPASLSLLCEGCEGGFHLAGYAKPWAPDISIYDRINVEGARAIARAASAAGVRRIVHVSSAGVLGPSLDGKPVHEDSIRALDFLNDYERTKAASEVAVLAVLEEASADTAPQSPLRKLEIVIVNPTRVYGPSPAVEISPYNALIARYLRGKWHILPQNGSKVGDYVFVGDVADGILAAYDRGVSGRRYLLGGECLSYSETFDLAARAFGKKPFLVPVPLALMLAGARLAGAACAVLRKEPPITPAWVRRFSYDWRVDSSRARRELGYRGTPASEAFASTVAWLRERGEI